MARITVEDCVKVVPNRFKLCLIAGNRAHSIMSGAETEFESKEKAAVVSLREIAEGKVDVNVIEENIIKNIQEHRGADLSISKEMHKQVEDAFIDESESIVSSASSPSFVSENLDVDD
jgi:DNA-directed RNA polymerase subunit omega